MDKLKAVVNDPAKLEEELKKAFEKMDADKKGYISHEVLKQALIDQAKALGLPKPEKEPTEAEKEAARKLLIQMVQEKLPMKTLLNLCMLESKKQKKWEKSKLFI